MPAKDRGDPDAAQLDRGAESVDRQAAVVFVGHLYREKGVFELVEAFAELHARRPGLRLSLAGEGREQGRLEERIEELGIADAVDVLGWIAGEAKVDLLRSAACFVLPSYYEGLPLALLEAMLAGAPVVASDVGAIPDVVEHEVHGLVCGSS